MLNVQSVFVLLIGWLVGYNNFGFDSDQIDKNYNTILPWVGILRVKSGTNQPDAVTGLIMIQKQLAVGNAHDVGGVKINTLRKFAKAMFNRINIWWECDVRDRVLHPEYFVAVKNTLALVYLSCDREDFYWVPVSWPTVNTTLDHVFTIGLTDRHHQLEQVTTRMTVVKDTQCDDFYKKEKLDYKSLQPTHRICYRELVSVERCVIDAGMALTVTSGDTWTLIGISIVGPGCSLPSRFIQFLPYIPWIKSLSPQSLQSFRRSSYWYKDNMSEPKEDQDTILLKKINDYSIVMLPSLAYLKEEVFGRCDKIHGVLMYREFGTIRAPSYTATAVYSLSLYDLLFPRTTCVMVTVMCNKRSKVNFWVSTGFHQEDIEDYVRIVPAPSRNSSKPPKILYLKDTYKRYRTLETLNLDFKFEFTGEAKLDLEFYGLNISTPLQPPKLPFLPKQQQVSGHLPDGADFNARDDEPGDDVDTNDSFYHF